MFDKAWCNLGAHSLLVDETLTHVDLANPARLSLPTKRTWQLLRPFADQVARILALHGAGRRQHRNEPERVRSAAGLIAGTMPTKGCSGNLSRSASITSVEAVLQA